MRYVIALLLAILVPLPSFAMGERPGPMKVVDAALGDYVRAGGVPGLTAALLAGGEPAFLSHGVIPGEEKRALNEDTLFLIASVSKVFTSVVLADLTREGLLSPDDPLQKFLPEGVTVPTRNGKVITLRHLATHTSGLPTFERGSVDRTKGTESGWKWVYERLAGLQLLSDPGEKYLYSNLGVSLLGHALELRSGVPYESLVAERLLRPLKMDRTVTKVAGDGEKPVFYFEAGIFTPAGGYHSSARDLARFVAGALGMAPPRLMESFKLTFQRCGEDAGGGPRHLGWHENAATGRLSHGGLQHAWIGIDTARRIGAVILCTGQTPQIGALGGAVLAALAGEKAVFPVPRPVAKLPAAALERLAGDYRNTEGKGGTITVTLSPAKDSLLLSFDGKGPSVMWPENERVFFCKEWDCELQFPEFSAALAPSVRAVMPHWQGEYLRVDL